MKPTYFLQVLCILLATGWADTAFSVHVKSESFYAKEWCQQHQGKEGVITPSSNRVDCQTVEFVIDFAYAENWDKAIGQSLSLAMEQKKQAGIALIVEHPHDQASWLIMNRTISHFQLPIRTWFIHASKGQ